MIMAAQSSGVMCVFGRIGKVFGPRTDSLSDLHRGQNQIMHEGQVARMKRLIGQHLRVTHDERLTEKTTFTELGGDSLDVVDLVVALEQEFQIEITDEELPRIQTVGGILREVEKKTRE